MSSAGSINYEAGLNVSTFLAGLDKCKTSLSSFGSFAGSTFSAITSPISGTIAALGALNQAGEAVARTVGPLAGLVQSAFALAGNAEQTSVAMKVMTGSVEVAADTIARLKSLADATPFNDTEIISAGKSLIAYGESTESVVDALTHIGDIASGVNAPIGELADLYGKARTAGTLYAEDINQLTGRGIPVLQQFAAQMGVTVGEVKKLGSEGKISFSMLQQAFADMTTEGGQFDGLMEQQSHTFLGLMSTMESGWDNVKTLFAAPIIDSLKPVLESAISSLDSLKPLAASVGVEIGKWATYINGAFQAGEGFSAVFTDVKIAAMEAANFMWQKFSESFEGINESRDEWANSMVKGFHTVGKFWDDMAAGMAEDTGMKYERRFSGDTFGDDGFDDDADARLRKSYHERATGPFGDELAVLRAERKGVEARGKDAALAGVITADKKAVADAQEKADRKTEVPSDTAEDTWAAGALAYDAANGVKDGKDQFDQDMEEAHRANHPEIEAAEKQKEAADGQLKASKKDEEKKAAAAQKKAAEEQKAAAKIQQNAAQEFARNVNLRNGLALGANGKPRGHIHRLDAAESLAQTYNRMSGKDKEKHGYRTLEDFVRKGSALNRVNLKGDDYQKIHRLSEARVDANTKILQDIHAAVESLGNNLGVI